MKRQVLMDDFMTLIILSDIILNHTAVLGQSVQYTVYTTGACSVEYSVCKDSIVWLAVRPSRPGKLPAYVAATLWQILSVAVGAKHCTLDCNS